MANKPNMKYGRLCLRLVHVGYTERVRIALDAGRTGVLGLFGLIRNSRRVVDQGGRVKVRPSYTLSLTLSHGPMACSDSIYWLTTLLWLCESSQCYKDIHSSRLQTLCFALLNNNACTNVEHSTIRVEVPFSSQLTPRAAESR